jgi:hypothetical protein
MVLVAAWSVSEARAQWGLYGSPEPLVLPAQQPAVAGATMSPAGPVLVQSAYQPVTANYGQPYTQVAANVPGGPGLPAAPPPGTLPYPPATPAGPATGNVAGPSFLGETMIPPGGPSAGCAGGNCGGRGGCLSPCGCGDDGNACPWYVTMMGLGMTRDRPNHLYTTAQTNNLQNQWCFDNFPWSGGGEITFGRRFCCGQWGVEATYWTLGEMESDSCATIPGPFSTPFTMKWVYMQGTTNYNNTGCTTADEWFDASPQHNIERMSEVHDAEINLVRFNLCGGGCGCNGGCGGSPLSIDALVGFRFFRFRDRLVFTAEHGPYCEDGSSPSPYEGDCITLHDEIANNLWGVQIGCNAHYRFCRNLSLFVSPRIGIFDNHMTLDYNIFAMDQAGTYYQGSSPTYKPLDYPIHACGDQFSVLTQIDVGLQWQVSCRWEALLGYRLIAVTGMGLADNQVPFYGNDTQAVANIDKNGHLLLHGVFGGLTYRF